MLTRLKKGSITAAVIGVILVLFLSGVSLAFEPQQWKEDIKFLEEKLPQLHKNLFFNISREEYQAKLSALKDKVENLQDLEVVLGLMGVFSSVGDSHTGINFQPFISKYYPVFFNRFGEDFYLTGVLKDREELLGSRLVSINGYSIEEITARLAEVITAENRADLLLQARGFLNLAEILQYTGITEGGNEYLFQTEEGLAAYAPGEREISGIARDQQDFVTVDYQPNKYQQGAGQIFWYKYYQEHDLLFFQYNQCWGRELEEEYRGSVNNNLPSFAKTTAELMEILKKESPEKFVVDLRYNSGGSSQQGTEFARKLGELKLDTKIYVLTGPMTFSSAIMNALDLANYCGAELIGEPTRGRPNHYGEVKSLTLPSTGLTVTYSTRYFRLSEQDTDSLYPEITVFQTYDDFINGIDTVMKKVEEM